MMPQCHAIMKDAEMFEPSNGSAVIDSFGSHLRIRRSNEELHVIVSLKFQHDIIFHRRFFSHQNIGSAYQV